MCWLSGFQAAVNLVSSCLPRLQDGFVIEVVLYIGVPFRVLFMGLLYYIGDLKRDPNLENFQDG